MKRTKIKERPARRACNNTIKYELSIVSDTRAAVITE